MYGGFKDRLAKCNVAKYNGHCSFNKWKLCMVINIRGVLYQNMIIPH